VITIHGDPLSVHTRKVIVTAILIEIDYKVVVPDHKPPNRRKPSPGGPIPALQDGGFTLADSTAICLYLENKQPSPTILPGNARACGRALWFNAYADGTLFRDVVQPLFCQTIVAPKIRKVPSDTRVIDHVFDEVQPAIFGYLESQIEGQFLVGDALTLADIAIASNFIVYQYIGYNIDAVRYPKLGRYISSIVEDEAFCKALDDEKPFVANVGLDRSFLDRFSFIHQFAA
jgi:glutathione S-transferase